MKKSGRKEESAKEQWHLVLPQKPSEEMASRRESWSTVSNAVTEPSKMSSKNRHLDLALEALVT